MADYFVRELPQKAVKYSWKNNKTDFCIPKNTFPDINHDIPIRTKAKKFSNTQYPVYGIFHEFEGKIQCLFFFKFIPTNSGYAPYICKCLGKRVVRNHWDSAHALLESHMP